MVRRKSILLSIISSLLGLAMFVYSTSPIDASSSKAQGGYVGCLSPGSTCGPNGICNSMQTPGCAFAKPNQAHCTFNANCGACPNEYFFCAAN